MGSLAFQKKFKGMHVRITEHKGNPCTQPELQHHFFFHHRLISLRATEENVSFPPGYWHIKLATVKPSWNLIAKNAHTEKSILIVGDGEVVTDISYWVTCKNGQPADIVSLTMKSLCDQFAYQAHLVIYHGAMPQILART